MADVVETEHEHKSSGIAKAGLTTGIIGTALGALNSMGGTLGTLLGGGNNNAAQASLVELQNENTLLKSGKYTDDKTLPMQIQLARYDEQLKALRTEVGQAIQMESVQRQNGDANLRQYVDATFIVADKCVPANKLNPPCTVWGTNLPSYANPVFAPLPPFGPYPWPFPPPPVTTPDAASKSTDTSSSY